MRLCIYVWVVEVPDTVFLHRASGQSGQKLQCVISSHLSAILSNIGLSPHHRSDVVVQSPVGCDITSTKVKKVSTAKNKKHKYVVIGAFSHTNRIFRRILFTTSSMLARDWRENVDTGSQRNPEHVQIYENSCFMGILHSDVDVDVAVSM